MPRKNPMPEREQQICSRLRTFREATGLSRAAFAREVGIDPLRLASYEHGRAPLRFGTAKFLCEKFDINQRWLARGILPMHPKFDVPMEYSYLVKQNSLFSAVFDGWLDGPTKLIEDGLVRMVGEDAFLAGSYGAAIFRAPPAVGDVPPQAVAVMVKELVSQWMDWLPGDLQLKYGALILKATESFQRKNAKRMEQLLPPGAREFAERSAQVKKTVLTYSSESFKVGGEVKIAPQWPALKKKLQKATEAIGAKPALAKALNVDPTQISQWLSDSKSAREPGGDYALRMQAWLNDPKR